MVAKPLYPLYKNIIKPLDRVRYPELRYFTRFFNDKLKLKKGGGLDGLTPTTFWKHYAKELDDIASRCLNGTYKFSAYKEKLILKGKDNFPRVLSVPSPCCAGWELC